MIPASSLIATLKQLPTFANLDDADFLKILSICECRTFQTGETMFQEGNPSKDLYAILNGEVEVSVRGVLLNFISSGPGSLMGEVSFFNRKPYTATTIARTTVESVVISFEALETLIDENPLLGIKIYKNFTLEILNKFRTLIEQVTQLIIGDTSKQVAHDIRSPLAALRVIANSDSGNSPEQQHLLKFVVDRIDSIANTLLSSSRSEAQLKTGPIRVSENSLKTLNKLLRDVIDEKKTQYESVLSSKELIFTPELEFQLGIVKVDQIEFARIISNCVDNSFQAIKNSGKIEVVSELAGASILIKIKDSGVGIPNEVLDKLGKSQITFGKQNGNGIGLYNTFRQIESWGGHLKIDTTEHVGTTVTISLPLVSQE